MTELERRLDALRDEVAWPPTPDLAGSAAARIAAEPRRRSRRPAWPGLRLTPALAAALAALIAVAIVLAASPGVRARVADWLGVGTVRIERVERLPATAGPGDDLGLGERTTLARARRTSTVPVVRALGAPDGVYTATGDFGEVASLVYRPGPGLPRSSGGVGALLQVLPGEDGLALVRKVVDPTVRLVPVRVNGAPGLFVEGRHVLVPPQRLAGNTLVWTDGGATFRLESELGRADALRLARSVG